MFGNNDSKLPRDHFPSLGFLVIRHFSLLFSQFIPINEPFQTFSGICRMPQGAFHKFLLVCPEHSSQTFLCSQSLQWSHILLLFNCHKSMHMCLAECPPGLQAVIYSTASGCQSWHLYRAYCALGIVLDTLPLLTCGIFTIVWGGICYNACYVGRGWRQKGSWYRPPPPSPSPQA